MIAELDARNLLCPMPVIRTQTKVKTMSPGEQLRVIGTDPGILNDIPSWCRVNGHQITEQQTVGHEYHITLLVGTRTARVSKAKSV